MTLHKFWSTQPIHQSDFSNGQEGPIDPSQNIKEEPYSLPAEFEWSQIDIHDPSQLHDLYDLLNKNYVEHPSSQFRFDYQPELLLWALQCPGWDASLHIGIRVKANQKLVAFISAIPVSLRTAETAQLKVSEVNFLCVHKKLRSKRFAPVLISEITRRSNLLGIRQGIFTAGIALPEPIAVARYFHRPLNPFKVLTSGFCDQYTAEEIPYFVKKFSVEHCELKHPFSFRKSTIQDIPQMYALFMQYSKNFALSPAFTMDEFAHWVMPRDSVLYSYVFCEHNERIVAFYTFYSLPTSVLRTDSESNQHVISDTLQVAYSFYFAIEKTPNVQLSLESIVKCMICEALAQGFDLMNMLDVFENDAVMDECGFLLGDGRLHYYLFNWHMKPIESNQIGFLLL